MKVHYSLPKLAIKTYDPLHREHLHFLNIPMLAAIHGFSFRFGQRHFMMRALSGFIGTEIALGAAESSGLCFGFGFGVLRKNPCAE